MIDLEKDLATQVKRLLSALNISYLVHRTDKRSTGVRGWPDLTFAYHGVPVVFELKKRDGKLSPEQKALHEKLASSWNGWKVFVIRSQEEAIEALESIYNIKLNYYDEERSNPY